jgi:hypothetical protein
MLKQDGGIKALLGMVRSGHADVIPQISRGIANFAKCESRVISQGQLNFPLVPQMFHSCFFWRAITAAIGNLQSHCAVKC